MMKHPPPADEYTLIYLPPDSAEWAGFLAQFTLAVAAREGRPYAVWAGERFTRTAARSHGIAALSDGHLLGVLFFEDVDGAFELTFPWTAVSDREVGCALTAAAVQTIRAQWPEARDMRIERLLLPDAPDTRAVEAAGFSCYWRKRMVLDLEHWDGRLCLPAGYWLEPWHIRDLEAAAHIVCAANAHTLDARLYAAFFGQGPADCRRGLLSILAGKYGPLHPLATLCAFSGQELVGVNLVIGGEGRLASIIEISMAPAHQGRGVGRALMAASLLALQDDRFERVELAVTAANAPALHLYRTLGFYEISEFAVCVLPEEEMGSSQR